MDKAPHTPCKFTAPQECDSLPPSRALPHQKHHLLFPVGTCSALLPLPGCEL